MMVTMMMTTVMTNELAELKVIETQEFWGHVPTYEIMKWYVNAIAGPPSKSSTK